MNGAWYRVWVTHGLRHLRFHCTRCGNCCRQFRVPLTDADLGRLVAASGLPPGALVDWLDPSSVDMTGEPESFVLLPSGRRLMTLAWRSQACSFLRDDQCSVHPERPMSCRTYPFSVEPGRRGGVRRLRLLDISDCSHTWEGNERAVVVAQQARIQRDELVRFTQRVLAFNRAQQRRQRLAKTLRDERGFFETLGLLRPGVVDPASNTTASVGSSD